MPRLAERPRDPKGEAELDVIVGAEVVAQRRVRVRSVEKEKAKGQDAGPRRRRRVQDCIEADRLEARPLAVALSLASKSSQKKAPSQAEVFAGAAAGIVDGMSVFVVDVFFGGDSADVSSLACACGPSPVNG